MEPIGAVSAAIDSLAEKCDSLTIRLLIARVPVPSETEPTFRPHPVPHAHLSGDVARTVALLLGESVSKGCVHRAISRRGGGVDLHLEHTGEGLDFSLPASNGAAKGHQVTFSAALADAVVA